MMNTWPKVRLGDCVAEPPAYGANASAIEFSPDLPRYVRITDIGNDGELLKENKKSLPLEVAQNYFLRTDDVVFARSGATVGKTYLHQDSEQPHAFAGYLIRFRLNQNKLLPKFLSLYTRSREYERWVLENIRSGAQPNINANEYSSLRIPLPPLPEQIEIARILGTWDDALSQLSALIVAKTQRKRALMQQLLSGARRFPGFEGQSWETYKLGELFWERNESNRPDLPLLSITADRGVISRDEVERKDTSNENKNAYLRIAPGDIGYNTMRMWQGVSALSSLEGLISPAYTVCVPNDLINAEYAACLFKSAPMISIFHRHSQGMVSDTLNLKFHHLSLIPVSIPPTIAEQKRIAQVLAAATQEIATLEKQRQVLAQQKRGLMQKLLRGEVRVTNL